MPFGAPPAPVFARSPFTGWPFARPAFARSPFAGSPFAGSPFAGSPRALCVPEGRTKLAGGGTPGLPPNVESAPDGAAEDFAPACSGTPAGVRSIVGAVPGVAPPANFFRPSGARPPDDFPAGSTAMTLRSAFFTCSTPHVSLTVTFGMTKPGSACGFSVSRPVWRSLSDLPLGARSASATVPLIDAHKIPDVENAPSPVSATSSPGDGEFGPLMKSTAFAPRSRASIAL